MLTKEKILLELERAYSDISDNIDDKSDNEDEIDCVGEDNVVEDIFLPVATVDECVPQPESEEEATKDTMNSRKRERITSDKINIQLAPSMMHVLSIQMFRMLMKSKPHMCLITLLYQTMFLYN